MILEMALPARAHPAQTDELVVMAAGATESTLGQVVSKFEAETNCAVRLSYGAVGLLRDRILSGVAADLAIVTPAVIEQLGSKSLLQPGSRVDLGRVGGGIAVRLGEPAPAVSSLDELRRSLLMTEEIYFPDPAMATAGAYVVKVADSLGVGEAVRQKAHIARGGKEAMRLLASSRARALGFTQISEILAVPEVRLIGPYPAPLQAETTYSGVILASAAHPRAAHDFLGFLRTSPVQERFREAGFEPVP